MKIKSYFIENNEGYMSIHCGWANGYVCVSKDHPLYGKHYNEVDLQVHGGLTFSTQISAEYALMYGLSEDYVDMWAFGFDTCHYGDDKRSCSEAYVKSEIESLKKQLEEYDK